MNSAITTKLRERNPFQLIVPDYIERMRDKRMPKPHQLYLDSWVEVYGTRTFGFKSQEELEAFRQKYNLK